jgi:hypothetical protein
VKLLERAYKMLKDNTNHPQLRNKNSLAELPGRNPVYLMMKGFMNNTSNIIHNL